MAQEYLDRLNTLVERLSSGGLDGVRLECRHFFSGAAVYARGRICMSWTPVGFALKVPEASRHVLVKQGATYLRYFPKAPIKKDYVVLPESMMNETKTLRHWAKVSVEYVLSQPTPKRKNGSSGKRVDRC